MGKTFLLQSPGNPSLCTANQAKGLIERGFRLGVMDWDPV
jgi:hypothetical protein